MTDQEFWTEVHRRYEENKVIKGCAMDLRCTVGIDGELIKYAICTADIIKSGNVIMIPAKE